MTRCPDFFIIGAPKSGTTSLARMLQVTPEIFIPNVKEPHYFGSDMPGPYDNYIRTKEEYEALYEGGDLLVSGDASVWYYRSLSAPQEIKRLKPDAKIIIILRSPADVLESLYIHKFYAGDEKRLDYREAIDGGQPWKLTKLRWTSWGLDYKNMPKWSHWLPNWLNEFGEDAVKIIIFEDFVRDPYTCYQDVCAFLNVVPYEKALSYSHENASKKNRPLWLQKLISMTPKGLKLLFYRGALSKVKEWLIGWVSKLPRSKRVGFDNEFKKRLSDFYEEDIVYMEKLLSRDLSFWRKS